MATSLLIQYLAVAASDSILAEIINRFSRRTNRETRHRHVSEEQQKQLYHIFRILKSCLMPLLLLYYLAACARSGSKPSDMIVLALGFGFGGDFLLEMGDKWFPLGTLSFLLGHVFYVIAFLLPVRWATVSPALLVLAVPFAGYGIYMLVALIRTPSAYPLRYVLTVYLAALISLSLSAFLRMTYTNLYSFLMVLIGSLLFLASDTILAFAQFQGKTRSGIMILYTAAQLLLIQGILLDI